MNCRLEMPSALQSHGWSLGDWLRAGCGGGGSSTGWDEPHPTRAAGLSPHLANLQPHLGCSRLLWRVCWRSWACRFNSALLNWVILSVHVMGWGCEVCAAVCFWASQEQMPLYFCSLGPNIGTWFYKPSLWLALPVMLFPLLFNSYI